MVIPNFLENLEEKALNIGDKSVAYPKFENILVLAGGAGSGKGFALSRFIAFDGKHFDEDAIETGLQKLTVPALEAKFAEQTGRYLDSINLKDPIDASIMHNFVSDNKLDKKMLHAFFLAQRDSQHKANAIMDVTLKDPKKIVEIASLAALGGYDERKIHIVWIVNDFDVAIKQNQQRSRTVSPEIMFKTHIGAAKTMKELVANTNYYRRYADGDYWIFFNKADIDNTLIHADHDNEKGKTPWIATSYNAVRIKKAGQAALSLEEINKAILDKINQYVPLDANW